MHTLVNLNQFIAIFFLCDSQGYLITCMYHHSLQDQGSKELFGGAMTDSEEEGIQLN